MPKKTKRRPAPQKTVDLRLEAKRHEKLVLERHLRQCRAVDKLARQLKRAVDQADYDLRDLSVWLSARAWAQEIGGKPSDDRQPEPANT